MYSVRMVVQRSQQPKIVRISVFVNPQTRAGGTVHYFTVARWRSSSSIKQSQPRRSFTAALHRARAIYSGDAQLKVPSRRESGRGVANSINMKKWPMHCA